MESAVDSTGESTARSTSTLRLNGKSLKSERRGRKSKTKVYVHNITVAVGCGAVDFSRWCAEIGLTDWASGRGIGRGNICSDHVVGSSDTRRRARPSGVRCYHERGRYAVNRCGDNPCHQQRGQSTPATRTVSYRRRATA